MSLFGLIPSAYAQTTAPASAGVADMVQSFAPIIIIVGIFYFLLIRPQQQKTKQLRAQLSQIRRGDGVVTAGGIIGTVARIVSDDEVTLDIAEGVRVRVVRSTITGITSKSEPMAASDEGAAPPAGSKAARRKAAANDGEAAS